MLYYFVYCLDLANDEDFKTLLTGGNMNVSLSEEDVSNISTIGKWFESRINSFLLA